MKSSSIGQNIIIISTWEVTLDHHEYFDMKHDSLHDRVNSVYCGYKQTKRVGVSRLVIGI
jgi:hypothetical protein